MFFSFIFIQIIIFFLLFGYLNLYLYKLPTLYCTGVTMLNNQTDLKDIYKYFSNVLKVNLHDILVVYNPYNTTLYPFTQLIIGINNNALSFSQLTFINNKPIVKACFDSFFDSTTNKMFNISLRKDVESSLVDVPIHHMNIDGYIVNNFILSLCMLIDKQLPYQEDCYSFNNPLLVTLNQYYDNSFGSLVNTSLIVQFQFLFSYIGQNL